MYHCVSVFPREREIPYDNVSPDLFRTHMCILKKERFNVIPLSGLMKIVEAKRDIPPNSIAITFDDGYKNNHLNALPTLEDIGFKAAFFIIAGAMGMNEPFKHLIWDKTAKDYCRLAPESRLPMNRSEVRELRELGYEIGSHGMTHRSIGNLSYKEGSGEIFRSKEVLEEAIEGPVTLFSYPFGSRKYNDFNQQTRTILWQAGYKAACTGEIGPVSKGDNLYELARIPVRETDTPFRFRQKLSGDFEWINPFKKVFQNTMPRLDKVL